MSRTFIELKKEIKEYCEKNNLNFEKAEKMCKCWNENFIALQYDDKKTMGKDFWMKRLCL